jgi:eukaryotic-like serine/threonine-protein kinase
VEVLAEIRYRKIRPIGVGEGMNSEVFLAFDPQLRGEIAVKEIPKAALGNSPTSYFEEASLMFASTHPHVVPPLYGCHTADKISVAMPYYQRGSLKPRIEAGPLPSKESLRIGHGVLLGLTQIHLQKILHLDIKPSNVLFDDVDRPRIADFGQARTVDSAGVVTAPRMYQLAFPPETLQTSKATVQSDVYQMGLLLYRLVNGNPHYEAQVPALSELGSRIVGGRFPNRDSFMPHVPKRLRTAIRKALRVNPAERYHSAAEMSDALAKIKIALDWEVIPSANGSLVWRASRQDRPDLVVRASPCCSGGWSTAVYTSRGQDVRAKRPDQYKRDGLSRKEADAHLKKVFAELSE